ncbi:solute carrier family 3 member 2b [Chanos chanos]|uniref:Solute carrier family 3 member 2b n=1 Tax=Chanos chanos TaxID=29144 RepID=A0A6J2W292_CHACN|nr:4F2 cell-surface antigen heavy chain-like [Chanos chanos]
MSKDAEVDMKDVELNEVDQEKQPMTAGETANGDATSPTITEKNGSVMLKIPEENETKFTGLSKEELLKVAGTPGWVRARWALLILFWIGWLGMLAAAIVIIVQAPPCKPIPALNWWNLGSMYQVGDVNAFTESPGLAGLEKKIDRLYQMKVKSLVVGPIHVAPVDQAEDLNFQEIASEFGSMSQFKTLVEAMKKKSMSVVLDLTPNYHGADPWYSNMTIPDVGEKLKVALVYWMEKGVDGFQFSGVDHLSSQFPMLWSEIKVIVQNSSTDTKKALIGVTEHASAPVVSDLLNSTGVNLLLSGVLRSSPSAASGSGQAIQQLYSTQDQRQLAWNFGDRVQGHLASLASSTMVKFNQLLLLTLPGIPVFNYGDEIGLEDELDTKFPKMLWAAPDDANKTSQDMKSLFEFFKKASEYRWKERSLLYGDYRPVFGSPKALAYVRSWDQSTRFVAAFNWDSDPVKMALKGEDLQDTAKVLLSTDTRLSADTEVKLAELELGPGQAVLMQYSYRG